MSVASIPPPVPVALVTSGGLVMISNIPKHHTRSLFPTYAHNRLHFSTSARLLHQSSFLSAIAFRWVSGTSGSHDYRPHCDTNDERCPQCMEVDPMDPISVCALFPTMQWFPQRLSGAWHPPFDKLALEWWIVSDRGDRRFGGGHSFQKQSTRHWPHHYHTRILPRMPKTLRPLYFNATRRPDGSLRKANSFCMTTRVGPSVHR